MAKLERGELRDALLAEVRAVCVQHGPEAISISKIGKRLGVSSGAPFRLFPSREHIFAALIETEMERLDAAFQSISDAEGDGPTARLTRICTAYVDHARQEPAMFRLSFSVSAKAMGAARLQKLGEEVYGKVRSAVAACLPDETAVHEIEARTYVLWSTIHGHVMLCLSGQMDDQDITVPDSEVIKAAVNFTATPS